MLAFLLAAFGLTFAIKETDGPFNICHRLRIFLLTRTGKLGVQIHHMLQCWFCTGWWATAFLYLVAPHSHSIRGFIVYTLAGAATSLMLGGWWEHLYPEAKS